MKVLHIINDLNFDCGAQNLVRDLVLGIKNMGVKSEVFILRGKENILTQKLTENGIEVIFSRVNNLYSVKQVFEIMKIVNEYDMVHTHLFPSQYWYIIAKLINGSKVKSVTTEHNTNNRRRNRWIFKYIEKFIYSKYDKVICISKGSGENLLKWIPSIKEKMTIIYNGIDVDKFSHSKPYERSDLIPGLQPETKLILMVARMSFQKDFETLIAATKLLPRDCHTILVGNGPKKKQLQKLAFDSGISNRVHFLGIREDVHRIMKSVDIFVLSSNWEGFGLVAVEAMACGLPVVASNVLGLSDIVKGYGILFSKGDPNELARVIQNILLQKEMYNRISESCRKRAEDFHINRMVENYYEVYKEVLKK